MKNRKIIYCAAALMAVFWVGLVGVESADAQAGSANYSLTAGTTVGGGGGSGSPNYGILGNVPLTGTGMATSANYVIAGGLPAIITGAGSGFMVFYDATQIQQADMVNQVLKVAYTNGVDPTTGTFYYRLGGANSYQSAAMTAGNGDTLVYNLSSSLLHWRGLEYYFVLTQGSSTAQIGTPGEPYVFVTHMTNNQSFPPTTIPAAKYAIMGVPLDIIGSLNVTNVFGDDFGDYDVTQWRLGRYNPPTQTVIEYPNAHQVHPGYGYWLIMRTPKAYGAESFSVRPNVFDYAVDYYGLALDSGWNMLANPFAFDISWLNVRFLQNDTLVTGHHASILEDAAWSFDGADYASVMSIGAWDGFFVHINRNDVIILFPYTESVPPPTKALPLVDLSETPSPEHWTVQVIMEAPNRLDNQNYLGVRADAEVGQDAYDFSEPPPPPGVPYLAMRLPEGDPRLRQCDFRPPFENGAEWFLDIDSSPQRTLTINGIDQLPEEMLAVLVLDNGTHIDLAEGTSIKLPENTRTARLVIGSDKYMADQEIALPREYRLGQNYPNPFNPVTNISYALPERQRVVLEVYNILGQVVKTLVDEEKDAGDYTVDWYSEDDAGQPVASGIYFYRMRAGIFSECRKMLLLK